MNLRRNYAWITEEERNVQSSIDPIFLEKFERRYFTFANGFYMFDVVRHGV
jgi:hypothetical protein